MTRHTAAPWIVSGSLEVRSQIGVPILIATCNRGTSKFNAIWHEAEANPRLIAAAPELLAALETCRDALGQIKQGIETDIDANLS